MNTIVALVIIVVVAAFVLYKNKDKLMGVLNKKAEGSAPGAVATSAPGAVATSAPGAVSNPVGPIDYAFWSQYDQFTLQTAKFPNGLPVGWDWKKYDAARGGPDSMTHTNNGRKIEVDAGREVSSFHLVKDHSQVLLSLPGSVAYEASVPLRVVIVHGRGSKGRVWGAVDGGEMIEGPEFPIPEGRHTLVLEGEAGAGTLLDVKGAPK